MIHSSENVELVKRLSRDAFRAVQIFGTRIRRRAPQIGGVLVGMFFMASAYAYFGIYAPSAFFPLRTIITIPEGASVGDIAELLYAEQVVRSPLAFRAIFKFSSEQTSIRAGDYYFDRPLTMLEVAKRLMLGEYGLEPLKVVVTEGATTYQMADLFAESFDKFDPVQFLLLAEEKEGYLFPDTYFFLPNADETDVLDTMERTFYERLNSLEPDIASFGKPIHEVVTMASLLEKEARAEDERAQIAGILWHRIEIGMPLQVDAVFGFIEKSETFSPKFSDLEIESPYNTYKNKGLPPGPIGSPSLSSLKAAVTPIITDALFYLHGRDGVLRIAKTYEEHLVNRRRYLD